MYTNHYIRFPMGNIEKEYAMLHTCCAANRYLVLPVVKAEANSKILFYQIAADGGRALVYDLDVAYAPEDPAATPMFVDLGRFDGLTLAIERYPAIDRASADLDNPLPYIPVFAPERDRECCYHTAHRPMVHFTTRYGWINDPNGLTYADGVYHMFYQHNPAGLNWGNMHWGHAVSGDLIHWCEWGDALYPDAHGTMFSGCGLPDPADHLGISDGQNTPLLFYYTAAANQSMLSRGAVTAQYLAYSADGGRTLTKLPEPVIPGETDGNRDPKIIWCEEMGCYVCALYMTGHEYHIYKTADLTRFTFVQKVILPDDAECPDLYPLTCGGERFWIFSGASDTYLVGKMTRDGFHPVQDAQYYRLGGGGSYAAQTFSGIDDRRIKVAWGQMEAPDACFTSQMNFPTEVRLDCVDGKYRLATLPIAEIAQLRTDTRTWEKTASVSNPLIDYLNGGAYEITIRFGKACAAMTVELYGLHLRILPEENILELPGRVLPLSYNYSGREVRLIIDTMSMEVFSDEGRIYTAEPCLPELQNRQFTLAPVKPMQVCEVAVSISPLGDIWE